MILSIIIVTYNVKDLIVKCIGSLLHQQTEYPYEIIVVDNASTDGTPEIIRQTYPWVKLIENAKNVGFPIANNQAVRITPAEWIFFLNPDTELLSVDTVSRLIVYLSTHPEVDALGCRLIYTDGTYQQSVFRFPNLIIDFLASTYLDTIFPRDRWLNQFRLGLREPLAGSQVEVLTGACLLIRRKCFIDIGMFDERFFMYYEDIDLCYRLNIAGKKIVYFPEVTCLHHIAASARRNVLRAKYHSERSRVYFYTKHYGRTVLIPLLFNMLLRTGIICIVFELIYFLFRRPKNIRAERKILSYRWHSWLRAIVNNSQLNR